MLAAEFHYLAPYVDEYMDMPFFLEHLDYRQKNPHPGALIKAFLGKEEDYQQPQKRLILPDSTNTPQNKQGSLDDFLRDWQGLGGEVR